MDRRFFLALLLTALVVVGTPLVFPGSRPPARPATAADSLRTDSPRGTTPAAGVAGRSTTAPAGDAGVGASTAPAPQATPRGGTAAPDSAGSVAAPAAVARRDTSRITAGGSEYAFVSPGAAPVSVRLAAYRNLGPTHRDAPVELVRQGQQLLRYRIRFPDGDTLSLDAVPMQVEQVAPAEPGVEPALRFTGDTPRGRVTIAYSFVGHDSAHLALVTGSLTGAPPGAQLLIDLPQGLASAEVDSLEDMKHLAYSFKRGNQDVESMSFAKLDTAEARVDTGAIGWVAVRNKYFLTALVGVDSQAPFRALRVQGAAPIAKGVVTDAAATAVLPLHDGTFAFRLYVGPQKYERLNAIGRDLVNVNPYGGWFAGIVQPFATIVMRVLLWLKQTTMLSYGWVLVIFGILVRLLIWPLNQSAMRSSIKMQRLQPQLQEIQTKYARDPEKQRAAMMKVYADHGMSPFSPVMGCLPMLIPTPVLFALYFVFQNTIEFRGVSFMWLPDLTLKDPYYITPIFMGLSMLVLSWIGMRAAPQNPQAKIMGYMMPAMMTMIFLNFPSGLNLYYAVQNVVALPQQWLLTRERVRAGVGSAPVLGKAKA